MSKAAKLITIAIVLLAGSAALAQNAPTLESRNYPTLQRANPGIFGVDVQSVDTQWGTRFGMPFRVLVETFDLAHATLVRRTRYLDADNSGDLSAADLIVRIVRTLTPK